MTKNQFKEAFKRGLGSAYLELKNSKHPEDYIDVVLWCCLHNTCYDMQCEGSRGHYLYSAISLYEDKSFFEEEIIKSFEKKNIDTWLFDQLCDLLFLFAINGSERAREALYKKYHTLFTLLSRKRKVNSICIERDNFEWICVWLTSLDGFRAFKKIVEQIGAFYIKANNSNVISTDWFYANAQDKFGKKRVDNYMCDRAKKSRAAAAFLSEVESSDAHRTRNLTKPTLEELVKACYETMEYGWRGMALRFSETASVEELTELAKIAVVETNPKIKLNLLWALHTKPFPLDESYVFELAESDDESIRNIAFDMMKKLSSDRIHDYAISLIKEKKEVANALSVLCYCCKPGDETMLIGAVKGVPVSYNDGAWHGMYMDVEDLLRGSSLRLEPSLFMHMYRKTLCSCCRSRLVETMYKRNILPSEILEQCLYDSYDDTRKFAARKLKIKR
jgi:hypothetical protein